MPCLVKCLGNIEEDAKTVFFFLERGRHFIYNTMDLLGGRMFRFKAELSVRNCFLGLGDRSDSEEQYFFKQFG
jgi:hypothetical protein